MNYTYNYPRPSVTVDIIIFKSGIPIKILLIKRLNQPFKNTWAFPGGFVDENEALEAAAKRELLEETGLRDIELKQLHAFGDPGRDPRGHTVSIIFWGIIKNEIGLQAGDDAAKAAWFAINELPDLAFDHKQILDFALNNLKEADLY